ncbi:MAG TPA: hypothetical protein VKC56_11240 [Gallionellaceae bacterium]|nr:hypothetical protein [Gallionellaceae bacterium]
MIVEGEVFLTLYAPGSKSEHEAVMLRTPEGDFLLRREEGNPFRDDTLRGLAGHRIRGWGRRIDSIFILGRWEVL